MLLWAEFRVSRPDSSKSRSSFVRGFVRGHLSVRLVGCSASFRPSTVGPWSAPLPSRCRHFLRSVLSRELSLLCASCFSPSSLTKRKAEVLRRRPLRADLQQTVHRRRCHSGLSPRRSRPTCRVFPRLCRDLQRPASRPGVELARLRQIVTERNRGRSTK